MFIGLSPIQGKCVIKNWTYKRWITWWYKWVYWRIFNKKWPNILSYNLIYKIIFVTNFLRHRYSIKQAISAQTPTWKLNRIWSGKWKFTVKLLGIACVSNQKKLDIKVLWKFPFNTYRKCICLFRISIKGQVFKRTRWHWLIRIYKWGGDQNGGAGKHLYLLIPTTTLKLLLIYRTTNIQNCQKLAEWKSYS